MEKGDPIKEYVIFQLRRKITNLYKQFLFILEDAHASKYNTNDEIYQKYRKRVLDHGNDTIREIEDDISKLDFELKK